MAKEVRRRRGTTAEHAAFTGALGEVTVDTDKDTLVVHDDATVGGFPMLREDLSNVDPIVGRNALELGEASLFEVGPHPNNLPRNSDLAGGAFNNVGTGPYELVQLDGSGHLPAINGQNLTNIAEQNDALVNRFNIALGMIRTNSENNIGPSLMIDGFADSFINQNGVDDTVSTNETYDSTSGSENYNNGAGASMVLESVEYVPAYEPSTASIVIIEQDVDSVVLNTDLIVELSRDGGDTFSTAVITDAGYFNFGSTSHRILTSNSVDLTSQGTGNAMVWRIRTPTSQALKIHAVAMQWRA